jgi:hypothetical protein
VDGAGRSLRSPADVRQFFSNFDFGDLLQNLDAWDRGDDDGLDEVDSVPDEEVDGLPSTVDQESAVAALSGVSNLGASRKRRKEDALRTFTEEDFEEGVERLAFRMIKANVDALFDRKRKPEDHVKAAQWVFGRTAGDFCFENCCLALGVRKDVLRLRVHYEFWRRWFIFPVEFPFLIDPVPDTVEGEIYVVAGEEGYELAKAAWLQPGIRSAALIAQVALPGREDKARAALMQLSERYIMSQQGDAWYLTGRNPNLRALDVASTTFREQRHQLSWSRMF